MIGPYPSSGLIMRSVGGRNARIQGWRYTTDKELVLYKCNNYGFSVPMVSRRCVPVLDKVIDIAFARRLAAKHRRDALRISLSTPTDGVAPLDKGMAIICEARLAVNVDKLTELAIITLIEH